MSNASARSARINKELYRSYRGDLNKLTFNSKPIINDLSKKAETYLNDAETILKAIEDHLRFSVPNLKLPAFYLLDSIVNNVGDMYVNILHGRLDRIFVDVWKSVDDQVKGKMERMLGIWRHGSADRPKNQFPEFVLRKIEQDLNQLKARSRGSSSNSEIASSASGDLLDNLTRIQSPQSRKRGRVGGDNGTANYGGGSAVDSADAYNKARGLKRQRTPPDQLKEPHHAASSTNQELLQDVNRLLMRKQVEMLRRPNDVTLYNLLKTLKGIKETVVSADLGPEQADHIRKQLSDLDKGIINNIDHHQSNGQQNGGDVSQRLQNLMSRPDLINSLSKVSPELSSSLGQLLTPSVAAAANNNNQGGEYTSFSQLEPILLDHTSITRVRPGIYNILYKGYGNQCKQCGWRTTDDSHGQNKMKLHMDWHFRRNLRSQNDQGGAAAAARKAPPRGWYVDQKSWEEQADSINIDGAESTKSTPTATTTATQTDGPSIEELKKMTVAVTDQLGSKPCMVCKENFERKFNEEEEEWCLVNAVLVDSKLIHATCRK